MSEEAPQLHGRTLGDFVVRNRIGEGGFGVVYRAEQPLLGREAVIKLLHTRHRDSPTLIQRFLREARLASRLDHPFAAHIYAFGVEPDGLLWIAMEMVQGTSLAQLLRERGRLPLTQLVPLIDRLCEVVHAAHERGVVHRDLKPANVMIMSRAGKLLPKLLDFGIAKALGGADEPAPATARAPALAVDATAPTMAPRPARVELDDTRSATPGRPDGTAGTPATVTPARVTPVDADQPVLTQAGQVMGSPPYMAPEQWLDAAAADARVDLYALGVLSYEALAGRRPFTGSSAAEYAAAHANAPLPPLPDELPGALHEVLRKALAKRPGDRYPDALAFSAAFRAAAGMGGDAEQLPLLDERIRARFVAEAPQPLAEAVAALDAASNAHQARDALDDVVSIAARYVALLALACRTRVGIGAEREADVVVRLLRELRQHALSDEGWLELARQLVKPFALRRDAHPIPELVDLCARADGDAFTALIAARDATDPGLRGDAPLLDHLRRRMPELGKLLEALEFLLEYPLVVARGGTLERWTGLRRRRRASASARAGALADGQPTLLDAEGRPTVVLWPVVQIGAPTPGAPEELFLLHGHGRHGARLIALPGAFERQDAAVWDWFSEHLLRSDVEDSPRDADRSPFRGLAAFGRDDAADYFGREREIETTVNRIRSQPFVAVVGPSGAGKSSFVQAGVVPALPASWRVLTLRPGPSPLAALAACLARAGLTLDAPPGAPPVLLIVDQLEELFTLCVDADERLRFASALASATRGPDGPLRVMATLRDDFLVRANELAPLRERLAPGLLLLGTPSPDELLRMLSEPLRRSGYAFEDADLPQRMVDDVVGRPGALALLSFTAARLWELRDRHFKQLPTKVYEALGGVGGALARHADDTLAQLGAEERRLVREAFRNLATAEGTRAVIGRRQLREILGPAGEAVIEKLIGARLLTASEGERGEERVEIVHEALLSAWPRLVEWRREDESGARLRDQLRAATRQWHERGRARGLLWREDALAEYRLWRARWPGALSHDEEAFAQASLAEAVRGRRRVRATVAAIVTLLALAVGVLSWANHRTGAERSRAEAERGRAEVERGRAEQLARENERRVVGQLEEQGRQLLLAGDAPRALAYLSEAQQRGASGLALDVMIAAAARPIEAQVASLAGHGDKLRWAEYSPDGSLIVTAGDDGTARLWTAAGQPRAVLSGSTAAVWAAHFDPAGRRVVVPSWDGKVRVHDLDGRRLATLEGDGEALVMAAWSPDGRQVAAAGASQQVTVWDVATGVRVAALAASPRPTAIAFSPDGRRIAVATFAGEVIEWATAGWTPRAPLRGHRDVVAWVGYSPDSRLLVSTSYDGSAIIWDRGALRARLVGHTGVVQHAAFSPDGRLLVTASLDRAARVWRVADGAPMCVLDGHTGAIDRVAFDAAGERIVTASGDGSARVWDAASCAGLASLQGHQGALRSAVFSADGQQVLTASFDGTARLWRAHGWPLLAILRGHTGEVLGVSASPDGRRALTYSQDGTARLWALDRAAAPLVLGGHTGSIEWAEWSAGGTRVVTASDDGTARVHDAGAGRTLAVLAGHGQAVGRATFSPDGATVATAGADGTVRLWDAATGRSVAVIAAGEGAMKVLRFSPDGRWLLAAGYGSARLFDARGRLAQTLAPVGRVFSGAFGTDSRTVVLGDERRASVWSVDGGAPLHVLAHGGIVESVRFDARGERVLTASEDGTAKIWNASTGVLLVSLEGHANIVFDAAFDPGGELVVTAGDDRTVRLWEASSGRELSRYLGHAVGVYGASFGPDGQRVLSAGMDRTAMVWALDRSTRPREVLARFVACRVPFRFVVDRVVPGAAGAAACDP